MSESLWDKVTSIFDSNNYTVTGNPSKNTYGSLGPVATTKAPSSPAPKSTTKAPAPQQPQGTVDTTYYSDNSGGYVDPYAAQRGEDLAYLSDRENELRGLLSRADTSLNQGLTSIANSYNKANTDTTDDKNRVFRDYGVKREDTSKAKDSAIGRVNTQARTMGDSLRRLIGLASGSGSSAYQLAAPNAVAREATKNRTGVMETFGQNFRDLDTAEGDATVKFEKLLRDLTEQRQQKEYDLRAGVDDRKNQIASSLAQIAGERARVSGGGYAAQRTAQQPYRDQINQRQASLDSLFAQFNPSINYSPVQVQQPNLRDYTVDRAALNANQTQGADQYSPYSQFLKKRNEQYV